MFVNAQKKGRWPMVNDFKDLRIEILLCGKASSVISWGYPPEMRAAICKDSMPNSSSNSPVLKGWKQVQSMEFLQLNFKKKQFPARNSGFPPSTSCTTCPMLQSLQGSTWRTRLNSCVPVVTLLLGDMRRHVKLQEISWWRKQKCGVARFLCFLTSWPFPLQPYNGFAATSNDIRFDMLWAAHGNNWVPDGTLGAQGWDCLIVSHAKKSGLLFEALRLYWILLDSMGFYWILLV
jgi:hypothetical protein